MLILRARENVYADAHLAKLAGELAHIDVHPAGVFTPERRQRAGVV
jgi:hypothetical protein